MRLSALFILPTMVACAPESQTATIGECPEGSELSDNGDCIESDAEGAANGENEGDVEDDDDDDDDDEEEEEEERPEADRRQETRRYFGRFTRYWRGMYDEHAGAGENRRRTIGGSFIGGNRVDCSWEERRGVERYLFVRDSRTQRESEDE